MADPMDQEATKYARKQFVRASIDTTQCDIRSTHGVVYIRGVLKAYGGAPYSDLRTEAERVARVLRQKAGIRDVIIEVQYK